MLPRYQCHKQVRASQIEDIWVKAVEKGETSRYILLLKAGFSDSVIVTREWFDKHSPEPGGYYVVYEDGYESYSPAKAFEEGYTLIRETTPFPPLNTPASGQITQTPLPEFKYPVCRGAVELGSACGRCEKCRYYEHLNKLREGAAQSKKNTKV